MFIQNMNSCHNNPEKSSTTKINKHTPSGYSLFTHCSSNVTKNKLSYYRGKDCMKSFCKDLKEHAIKIINYEKEEMIPLTKINKINYIEIKYFVTYAKKNLVLMIKKSDNIMISLVNIEELLMMFAI